MEKNETTNPRGGMMATTKKSLGDMSIAGESGYYEVRLIEELGPDQTSTWFAVHPDLPGCHAVGITQAEALDNLHKSRKAWLSLARESDIPVAESQEHPSVVIQYAMRPGAARAASLEPATTREDISVHAG